METITEDYVLFEIAKLLKEKGFDKKLQYYYDTDGILVRCRRGEYFSNKSNVFIAPTLQMTEKWLRRVHNIHIVIKIIKTYGNTKYYYELYGTKNRSLCVVCDIYKGESWDSNERACNEAIKYCLENLV